MKLAVVALLLFLFSLAGGKSVNTGGFCHNCARARGDLELKEYSPLCTKQENAGNPLCATSVHYGPEITKRDDVISLDDLYRGNYGYEKDFNNHKHLMIYE